MEIGSVLPERLKSSKFMVSLQIGQQVISSEKLLSLFNNKFNCPEIGGEFLLLRSNQVSFLAASRAFCLVLYSAWSSSSCHLAIRLPLIEKAATSILLIYSVGRIGFSSSRIGHVLIGV
jgi:hypothetical protein